MISRFRSIGALQLCTVQLRYILYAGVKKKTKKTKGNKAQRFFVETAARMMRLFIPFGYLFF
jgi:hypothetical protein